MSAYNGSDTLLWMGAIPDQQTKNKSIYILVGELYNKQWTNKLHMLENGSCEGLEEYSGVRGPVMGIVILNRLVRLSFI